MNAKSLRVYLYLVLTIAAFAIAGFFGSRTALILLLALGFVTELAFWFDAFRQRKYQ